LIQCYKVFEFHSNNVWINIII